MNRIVGVLLLILAVVALGFAFFMARDRDRLSKEAAKSGLEQARLIAEVQEVRAQRDKLQRELDSALKAAAAAAPPAPASVAKSAADPASAGKVPAPKVTPQQGMKAWAEMLKKPEMKDMIRQQQYAAMESQYGSLFARFQFDEAEKEDFKKLMVDRLMAETDLGLKVMDTDLTKEQRDVMAKEFEEAKKVSDAQMRDFLNSDTDFATFQNWEDTKAERMQLQMGQSLFANSGEPLTAEQEEQLVKTMHEVNRRPSDLPDISKLQNFDPAKMGQVDIEKQLAWQDRKAQAVLEASGQFLSPKQLEALKNMQSQWRTMSATGLRMSSAMFKGE